MKKRFPICAAIVAAGLLLPVTAAGADHRHHRHHRHHHSSVGVSVGIGAYPVYGPYYYDPYSTSNYGYYYVPAPDGVYYSRYPTYHHRHRPSVGVFFGW